MASEQDVTSDSLDSSVVDVPYQLMDYVKSSIIDYINKEQCVSAKIQYFEGQSPKLVVSFERPKLSMGRRSQPPPSPPSTISDEMMQTSTIIVKNLPASADEELLELFFESTKKQGGGPVKSVKMLRDKNAAFVEFCENEAVQTVMKKRPLKFGTTEIEAQPFKPLLKGSEIISSVDLKGLPDEFTKELLKKNLDFLIPNQNSDKIDIVDISEYRQYHQGYEYLDKSSKSNATRKQLFGRSDIDDYNPFSPLT